MKENIIAFVVIVLVCIVMMVIGISQIKSKKPVGFYSGEKPPLEEELIDVVMWNKKHGLIWLFYEIAMLVSFVAGNLIGNEFVASMLFLVVILGGIPMMILRHNALKKKYYRK